MRLAVCGGKGGCGKTTTALMAGGVLADARRHPIVVDCDRDMPNLHVYAGTTDEPGVDVLAEGAPLDRVAHAANRPPGVSIVPAIAGCDVGTALANLDVTARGRRYILDVPAGANEDVAVPLRAADASLLVTTPSGPCIRATVKTAAMASALDAPPVGAVVSRATRVPRELPQAIGLPRTRIVPIPPVADPLTAAARQPLGRLVGWLGPNA